MHKRYHQNLVAVFYSLVFAVSLHFTQLAVAQNTNCLSFPQPFYDTGDEPCALASGDFDGDGDNDIVTANLNGDDVTVLLNDGSGRLIESSTVLVGNGPKDIACVDLNNDGDLDIITCNQFSDNVSVLIGNGNGTFNNQQTYDSGDLCIKLAVGDLNGDGFVDAITGNRFGDNIAVLFNTGNGSFHDPELIPAGSFIGGIAISDMNGDSFNDAIVIHSNGGFVFLNNGSGQLVTKLSFSVMYAFSITTGDFDNDGDQDVATASLNSDAVEIFTNNGSGVLVQTDSYPAGDAAAWIQATDLDDDSDVDLIFVNSAQLGEIGVLANQGDGTFAETTRTNTRQHPQGLTITDLNGDGNPDAATTSSDFDTIETFLGNGNGSLVIRVDDEIVDDGTIENSISVATGDLNMDELDDLVIVGANSSEVQILLNSGDNSFQVHQLLELGQYPHHAVISDLDNDGDNDLAVSDRFDDDISVHFNDGAANFQSSNQLYDTGDRPRMTLSIDLNGDGNLDLVTPNFGTDDVSVLINNGNGTFLDDTRFSVGEEPISIAGGDFDSDGDNDLVVANRRDDTLSILLNNGSGGFAELAALPTNNNPVSVALTDINGDGDLDIVTSHSSSSLLVFLGQSGASFGNPTTYQTGGLQSNVSVGDFNGDDHMDVVAFGNGQLTVLLNDGSGLLDTIDRYRARLSSSTANWMATANINGDKLVDVICAYNENRYTAYINSCYILGDVNSDGLVNLLDVVPFVFLVTSNEFSLAADINCDGHVDLLDVQPFVALLTGF